MSRLVGARSLRALDLRGLDAPRLAQRAFEAIEALAADKALGSSPVTSPCCSIANSPGAVFAFPAKLIGRVFSRPFAATA